MRVIGIDCGTAITGWAVLESNGKMSKNRLKVVGYGVIRTDPKQDMGQRLVILYEELFSIIKEHKPTSAGIESLFYFKNQKTVMSVGQSRGVIMLAVVKNGLKPYDYTPLQVKQAITGYGKATKDQIQKMVKAILKLEEIPRPDDAADALAIAICHLNTRGSSSIKALSSKV